jgi:hypothetical protein
MLQSVKRTKEMSTESNSSQVRNRTSFSCNTSYTSKENMPQFEGPEIIDFDQLNNQTAEKATFMQ